MLKCGSTTRVISQMETRNNERGIAEKTLYLSYLLVLRMESCFGNRSWWAMKTISLFCLGLYLCLQQISPWSRKTIILRYLTLRKGQRPKTATPGPFGAINKYILKSNKKRTPRALPLLQSGLYLFLARWSPGAVGFVYSAWLSTDFCRCFRQ